jgi:protein-disulfide isomerase
VKVVNLGIFILVSVLGLAVEVSCQGTTKPLAEVDGIAITSEEVEKSLASHLSKLEEQIYNLKRQKVDALINDKLLEKAAAKRGISVTALFDAEVTPKVTLVTEQEIENFYQANKAQVKAGEETQAREQMRAYLQNQKIAQRRQEFIDSLRSQAKIVVNLKAPPVLRVDVKIDGAPFKGGKNAPVTVVEFTDVHCPFCQRVLPTLTQLLSRYGDKVKLVYKDFPIDKLHPGARKGHEAARCADEQGKFWPYHDKLFANAPKASPDDLKAYGKEVGLDSVAFDTCVSSGKYQAAVEKDIEEGRRAGVTGTPAFFVNGRLLTGAQPLENFVRVIDDELAHANKN